MTARTALSKPYRVLVRIQARVFVATVSKWSDTQSGGFLTEQKTADQKLTTVAEGAANLRAAS
jgi:hypothetical protein